MDDIFVADGCVAGAGVAEQGPVLIFDDLTPAGIAKVRMGERASDEFEGYHGEVLGMTFPFVASSRPPTSPSPLGWRDLSDRSGLHLR